MLQIGAENFQNCCQSWIQQVQDYKLHMKKVTIFLISVFNVYVLTLFGLICM